MCRIVCLRVVSDISRAQDRPDKGKRPETHSGEPVRVRLSCDPFSGFTPAGLKSGIYKVRIIISQQKSKTGKTYKERKVTVRECINLF